MKVKILITIIAVSVFAVSAYAEKKKHPEKWYQEKWCAARGGQAEVRLPDRTRVDCLTDEYAIEFDFGRKHAEALGQALYYAIKTGKKAGIVLIVGKRGQRYIDRLNTVITFYKLPVRVWVMAERKEG